MKSILDAFNSILDTAGKRMREFEIGQDKLSKLRQQQQQKRLRKTHRAGYGG